MDFGVRVRVVRTARGLTQSALASISSVSRVTLWQLESGGLMPSPEVDSAIRAALGWTPEVDSALDALAAALQVNGDHPAEEAT